MKKIIIILIILALIGTGGYYYYNNIYLPSLKPTIETEKSKVSINKYYIYGTHLNIEGNIKKINAKFKDVDLILWNIKDGKTKKYEINYSKNVNAVDFNISDEINPFPAHQWVLPVHFGSSTLRKNHGKPGK